jgi:hypothetical protein
MNEHDETTEQAAPEAPADAPAGTDSADDARSPIDTGSDSAGAEPNQLHLNESVLAALDMIKQGVDHVWAIGWAIRNDATLPGNWHELL